MDSSTFLESLNLSKIMDHAHNVFITDSHHKVLEAWAAHRKKLKSAPRVITLDHHTDTSEAFRRHLFKTYSGLSLKSDPKLFKEKQSKLLNQIDFNDELSVFTAIKKLNNDEHIIAAQKTDIVSEVLVIAHNAATTDESIFKNHRIICYSVPEKTEPNGQTYFDNDNVLESSFLNEAIGHFNKILSTCQSPRFDEKPYILDVDLDYFNSFKSCEPDDQITIKKLIKNASLITIATEPVYVVSCAVDRGLTSKHLKSRLLSLF